jgi:hypothetical protein
MNAGASHATSIVIAADAPRVFAFMADSAMLPRWSFGTWEIERLDGGIVRGKSLFDGSHMLVRIESDERTLAVDYHLGQTVEQLAPRIFVRVVPGPVVGLGEDACVLTFLAWRAAAMTDDRWRRLTASHELEVVLIKNLFESGQIT